MKEPPKEAIAAREYFSENESHELFPVAEKLLINPPLQIQTELNKMWVQIIKNPPKFNNEIANGLAEKIKELMSNNNIKKLLEKQQIEDMQLNPEKYPNKNVAKPIFDLLLEVNECISFPSG